MDLKDINKMVNAVVSKVFKNEREKSKVKKNHCITDSSLQSHDRKIM